MSLVQKNISVEYNAVDFFNFIPLLPTLVRGVFNKSETRINCPGSLIYLFLGDATQVTPCLQISIKTFLAAVSPFPILIPVLVDVIYHLEEEYKTFYKHKLKTSIGKVNYNVYNTLFNNYKNVTKEDITRLQIEFNVFKSLVKVIKQDICTSCEPRKLNPIEISHMKLFQPKKIEKDVLTAINHYEKLSPDLVNLSNDVLKFIQKEILVYIEKNIKLK